MRVLENRKNEAEEKMSNECWKFEDLIDKIQAECEKMEEEIVEKGIELKKKRKEEKVRAKEVEQLVLAAQKNVEDMKKQCINVDDNRKKRKHDLQVLEIKYR